MGTRVRALARTRNILNAASHSPLREVGENPHERSARIRPARRITFARGEIKACVLFALDHGALWTNLTIPHRRSFESSRLFDR